MHSISKSQQKLINSLKYKKYRHKNGLFVVEGIKVIKEFLNSNYSLKSLYSIADVFSVKNQTVNIISPKDLKKISFLNSPQVAVGVFKIKTPKPLKIKDLTLALDGVKDPGNLGTIIRLCDWFGIKKIVCSEETVDCYNPKVVQASMGSLTRVKLYYQDLKAVLSQTSLPIYAADMNGQSIYKTELDKKAILLMGSESHGISYPLQALVENTLSIPQFGKHKETDSLNVAMATSIMLSEFKRRTIER
ncbi:RNA methyltransferase [Mesohalobacter halotolerans]|jgi:TrmH family RNA methyltransferase|uniref:RNA methyltransferase n=1 Tax=Mesohalobacter halotolerans TaxID=1883405 RepID=A0A4U5TR98_9FLAO|nr:RNA methyltransferase [Mesohalobacter halotolerans]NBC58273.1 RNA methyltransferase [Bacteroidota bacterium]TKS56606.1 RNA methyltransferase [Mesohalobacter halotolerans]